MKEKENLLINGVFNKLSVKRIIIKQRMLSFEKTKNHNLK